MQRILVHVPCKHTRTSLFCRAAVKIAEKRGCLVKSCLVPPAPLHRKKTHFEWMMLSIKERCILKLAWNILLLSKPNANSTQLNLTQCYSKQLALRLDTVATWNPPTTPPQQTFQTLLEQLESCNLAQTLTRPA